MSADAKERMRGMLLGLAVGDALGVPVEFMRRGTFHVTAMEGYGTHNQPPGTWSDDTSMTLAMLAALSSGKPDMAAIARNFIAWRDKAAFTPHGKVFDVGNATNRAIERLKDGVEPTEAGGTGERDNGNGSLMRIAPLVFYIRDKSPEERYKISRDVSAITHAHPIAVTACFIYLEMLDLLLQMDSKLDAYSRLEERFRHYAFLDKNALRKFARILNSNVAALPESEIRSSGYVVDTLEASFWAFLNNTNYRDAVLTAVNLGDDTDTTGAVTGAMAGLYYRERDIPEEWLKTLVKREEIAEAADKIGAVMSVRA